VSGATEGKYLPRLSSTCAGRYLVDIAKGQKDLQDIALEDYSDGGIRSVALLLIINANLQGNQELSTVV